MRGLQASNDVFMECFLGINASVLPFCALSNAQTKVLSWPTKMRPGYPRYGCNELISAMAAPKRGKFDIYHSMLYRAIRFVRSSRLVVTHHDCTHERFPHLFHNASYIIRRKRKLFSDADAIICVSEASRSDLLHFYDVAEAKTHVVHHGFSPLPFAESPFALEKERYLLYVGSRSGYKNFPLLLEAFSRSGLAGAYRLVVVGGGAFSTTEQARIHALSLTSSITAIPKADDAILAQAYRNAALFVYPSLYEGFGFPPLEAMSLGCPVLVHRTSALPEVCGDAAFYFDTPHVEVLAGALVSTLQDTQGIEVKRRLGRQQVKQYDWSRTASSTLEVYRGLFQG